MRGSLSGTYVKSTDSYKFVQFIPDNWKNDKVKHMFKMCTTNKVDGILQQNTLYFQNKVMEEWNPITKEVSQAVAPAVTLHDKKTVDEYGKSVIELLEITAFIERKIEGKI